MRTASAWIVLLGIALVCVALLVAIWVGARRHRDALYGQIASLRRAVAVEPRSNVQQRDALPVAVARYLRLALPATQEIREVHLRQSGTLRTDARTEHWISFEAEHTVFPPLTAFVWNARVRIAPLLHVRVRDSLVEGRGSGQVDLLSAFTMGADTGTPEMNSGSLHRYLAEAVWYPSALLPSSALTWTDIDTSRSLATLTSHGVTVSLEFRFAESGEVTGIYTPGRWGKFSDGYRRVPWEGHFRNYRHHEGLFVPSEGDVGWYLDHEWRAVWQGTITAFEVERAH